MAGYLLANAGALFNLVSAGLLDTLLPQYNGGKEPVIAERMSNRAGDSGGLLLCGRPGKGSLPRLCHPTVVSMCWLLLAVLLLGSIAPPTAAAMELFFRIEDRITVERFDVVKQHISPLRDVQIETIRYFEIKNTGGFTILRLEDEKYCGGDRCVTFVANETLSSYVAVYARNEASCCGGGFFSLGERDDDRGYVVFLTSADGRDAKVFVSGSLVVVLP